MGRGKEIDSSIIEERERYRELLEELRTIIPGVQVLLAFLLTVPFAAGFEEVDKAGKVIFTVSLMAVALAAILFLAPASYHRLADRKDRRGRISFGVRVTLAGMALLALSITCAVFVVVRFLFGSLLLALILASAAAALSFFTWYLHPVKNRRHTGGISESSG